MKLQYFYDTSKLVIFLAKEKYYILFSELVLFHKK